VAGVDALRGHRLSREIIVTQLVNDMVDLMGVTFLFRVMRDTGAAPPAITRAWLIASRLCGARELRAALARIENELPAPVLHFWVRGLEHVLERTARWVLANVSPETSTTRAIAEHEAGLEQLRGHFIEGLPRDDRAAIEARIGELRHLTSDERLPERLTTLRYVDEFLEIVHVARDAGVDPERAARAYYVIAELFEVSWLRQAVTESAQTRWDHRLAAELFDDLARAHRTLTAAVAGSSRGTAPIEDSIAQLRHGMADDSEQFRALLAEIRADPAPVLTAVAFAVRQLCRISRRVAAQASTHSREHRAGSPGPAPRSDTPRGKQERP
jgi:glutamate dehydrogenase